MNKKILTAMMILFLVGGSRTFAGQTEKADLIIKNGKVFTANDAQPWAEAVACNSGKIIEVGTGRDIDRLVGPATRVLDVQGRLVIPGLIDAHTHFSSGGRSLVSLSFRGVNTIAKVQEMVTAKIKELPPGALVSGSEYDHTLFPGGNWPTKEDLDKVSPDNPVVIRRVDGHSIWVNSQALKRSGITRDTKDPFGGEILRNPKTGEPMGILTEAATGMVKVRGDEVKSTPSGTFFGPLNMPPRSVSRASTRIPTSSRSSSTISSRRKAGSACAFTRGFLPKDWIPISARAFIRARAMTWCA